MNTWKRSGPPHAGASPLYVAVTAALIRPSLTAEQPACGFNWDSERVLAPHQMGRLDGYFKWSDMNSRGSDGFVVLVSHLSR